MLSRIIQSGVKEDHDPSDVMRIKLLNKMVLVFISGVFIKFLFEVYMLDKFGIIISASFMISLFLVIILNKYQYYITARIYIFIVNTAFLVGINILYGRAFGAEFILFPLIMASILYFESTKSKLIWITVFALSYIVSCLYLKRYEPLFVENLDPNSFYFTLIISALGVFFLSSVFINENIDFRHRMDKLLRQMRAQNKDLEIANNELEKFAYVASHDLKTPLRNINSFLELIEYKFQKGETSEISEYLEYASLNAKRMHNLIQDVLEFSRINTKELSFKVCDLNLIIQMALDNMSDLIQSKKASIQLEALPKYLCNNSQMVLLFQNLIENGIKYNVSKVPEVCISVHEKPKEFQIFIKDNGIGIEQEYRDKVFDMFFRLHNQEEYTGTGIGLATSKKIAMYHGGELNISNSSSEGTTFCLKLLKHSEMISEQNKNNNFKTEHDLSY